MHQVTLAFSILFCLFNWSGLGVALGQDDKPADPPAEVEAEGKAIAKIFDDPAQEVGAAQEPVKKAAETSPADKAIEIRAEEDAAKEKTAKEKAEEVKAEEDRVAREKAVVEEEAGGEAVAVDAVVMAGQVVDVVMAAEVDLFAANENEPLVVVLTGYVNTECGLARRACELTPEQLAALKKLDVRWVKEQIAKPEKVGQVRIMQGLGRFLGGARLENPAQNHNQTHQRVCKLVDEVIQKTLSSEQYELFESERAARDAFHRDATASALVAVYDKHVFVKREQRQELIEDVAKWVKSKNLYWQFYFQNDAYIPTVPNAVLARTLSDKQLKTLQGLNSYSYEMDEVQMQMNGMRQVVEFTDE